MSKIKIDARRRVKSASRIVKNTQRKLSNAQLAEQNAQLAEQNMQMESQMAFLEEQIALLKAQSAMHKEGDFSQVEQSIPRSPVFSVFSKRFPKIMHKSIAGISPVSGGISSFISNRIVLSGTEYK